MNNQVLFKFVEELRQQCRWGKLAFDNLRVSLQGLDNEKTFFHVHALLSHAEKASRLLWPAREESRPRGAKLRAELKVVDDSPINLRAWYGRFAASDEQLDDWIALMERPDYVEFNVMPQGSLGGYKQDSFQRSLDPETFHLVFRNESFDLRKLATELHRIETTAQAWLRNHNPW